MESKLSDSNFFDVCLTQLAKFNNWHINILVSCNAFSCFMASSIIWSFYQKLVKKKLKQF